MIPAPTSNQMPRSLVVEAYRGCNYRCGHCNVPDNTTYRSGPMRIEVFTSLTPLIQDIAEIGYDNYGEPLLNPDLPKLISIQKRINPNSRARFNSSLSGLTEAIAYSLLDSGINEIQVSFDAATSDLFSHIKVGGQLKQTIGNIELLMSASRGHGDGSFVLSACFLAQNCNIQELPQVARILADNGVTDLYVNGLEPYRSEDLEEALWFNITARERAALVFEDATNLARDLNIRIHLPALIPQAKAPCHLPSRTMTVSYDGAVSPCFLLGMESPVFTYEGSEILRPRVDLGNTATDDPLLIWGSDAYRAFKQQAANPAGEQIQTCRVCIQRQRLICVMPTGTSKPKDNNLA